MDYCSGTTANPKGAMLSQDNVTWTCASAAETYGMVDGKEEVRAYDRKGRLFSNQNIPTLDVPGLPKCSVAMQMISYLPVSHIVAQIADIWMIPSLGGTIHFADRDALRGSLLNTLTTVRPTRFVAVPRVFEKMHQQLETTFSQATGPKAALLNWATKVNT